MPIPTPNKDEEKDKFISRCIGALRKTDSGKPITQIAAMCYTSWKEDKNVKQELDPDEVNFEWFEDEHEQPVKMAKWTTEHKNNLPDSCFAVIEAGGSKDEAGKTVPRSLRHLPYKTESGVIDREHLLNALAQLPKTDIPEELKSRARGKLCSAVRTWNSEHSGDTIESSVCETVKHAMLELSPIKLVDGLVKVIGGEVYVNFTRRIPERDIYLEVALSQIFKDVVQDVGLEFNYRTTGGVSLCKARVYDLVLVPRKEETD